MDAKHAKQFWTATALQDLTEVLHLLETPDPSSVDVRLACEPFDGPLDPTLTPEDEADGVAAAKVRKAHHDVLRRSAARACRALDKLQAPTPRRAAEAATMAAKAWTRMGDPDAARLEWVLGMRPGEVFEVHPHQLRLSPGPSSRYFEPRLHALAEPTDLVDSAKESGGALWSVLQVDIDEDGPALEVVAGSRRVRTARIVRRLGLSQIEFTTDGTECVLPPVPPQLKAIVARDALSVYLADNLLGADETPWTTAARFIKAVEVHKVRITDLVQRTGLSRRAVSYYVSLGALAPEVFAEGLAGRLVIRVGTELARVPEHAEQVRLMRATAHIRQPQARIAAIRAAIASGTETASDARLEAPPLPGRVGRLRSQLQGSGAAAKEVKLLDDFLAAAFEADESARLRLPLPLQALFKPTKAPARTQATGTANCGACGQDMRLRRGVLDRHPDVDGLPCVGSGTTPEAAARTVAAARRSADRQQ